MGETSGPCDASSERGVQRKGEDLRVHFECPKCGAVAWVEWRRLPHLLRCRGCQNSFWIDKSGRIESEHETGSVLVKCPRCQETRPWPKRVAVKQYHCLACGFDFSLDTDSSPDSLSERLATPPPKPPAPKKKPSPSATPPAAVAAIIAAMLLVLCVSILAIAWAAWTDETLMDAVQAFNAAALAGETEKAKEWVSNDQGGVFDTWMLVNTSNRPLVRFEPIEVEILQYSFSAANVRVSYQRTIQEVAHQDQAWRRDPDGRWQFDPAATLQQQDQREIQNLP